MAARIAAPAATHAACFVLRALISASVSEGFGGGGTGVAAGCDEGGPPLGALDPAGWLAICE